MTRFGYARWDGSQSVPDLTADELMQQVAHDVLQGRDVQGALRRIMRQGADLPGGRRMMGMRDLLDRLRGEREGRLARYNLGSSIEDVRKRLDQVVQTERDGIQRRLGEGEPGEQPDAPGSTDPMFREIVDRLTHKRLEQLDQLPSDAGARIRELRDYDFLEPAAREQFNELLKMLQEQVLQSYFRGLQQNLQALTPEALREIRQMTRDLNKLLEAHRRGEHPDVGTFLSKWGKFFPPGMKTVEELAQHLREQMRQMESLLRSMTPEMRQEIESMLDAVFQDEGLRRELAQLGAHLQQLLPRDEAGGHPFSGDEPLTLQEALRQIGQMDRMDDVERQLLQGLQANDASDLDSDEIGDLLGHEAGQMAQQLQELTKMLEEAGFLERKGQQWALTPRASRRIGERALEEIFGSLRDGVLGNHPMTRGGPGHERLDETRPYVFGDPFLLDAQESVMNAVRRAGAGKPVRLLESDFEVHQTGALAQCSTVIMLDMSYSMMMGGRFAAGRKVALALDSLIRSKFPRDNLDVVAFSYFVLALKPHMLLDSSWVEYGGGTNFQEALRQARLLLRRYRGGTKQIVMVTDGEPTTYNAWRPGEDEEGDLDGLRATLREVGRCTRDGITINSFIMDAHASVLESGFMRAMTRLNRGRAFLASSDELGSYILVDYLGRKQGFIR